MENLPKWAKNVISDQELESINNKIKSIESVTSAEIVTVIANKSSVTNHLKLIIFLLLTVIGFFIYFVCNKFEVEIPYETTLFYVFSLISFLLAMTLPRLTFIQKMFTHKLDRLLQVQSKSELEFYIQRVNMTRSETGVLIYLSLMEKQAVVLADKSIAEKFPENTWQEIVNIIIEGIHKKNVMQGIFNGLDECQNRLSKNFPIEKNDTNELPNQVILRTNP